MWQDYGRVGHDARLRGGGLHDHFALGPATIGYLRRLKFGQTVRNDGPQTHLKAACRLWAGCSYFACSSVVLALLTGGFVMLLVAISYGIIGLLMILSSS